MAEQGPNVLICTAGEMIDRLSADAEAGTGEAIALADVGQPQAETLEMMSRFAAEVVPQVHPLGRKAA